MRKRSRLLLYVLLFSCVSACTAGAAKTSGGEDVGLGVMLGSPTGLSAKYWMDRKMAIDGGLGASFESDVKFQVHGDFLFQIPLPAKEIPGELPLYLGFGPRIRIIDKKQHSSKVEFGIRLPVGVEFNSRALPLNFFMELAPVIVATPEGGLSLEGAVGLRYRFGK